MCPPPPCKGCATKTVLRHAFRHPHAAARELNQYECPCLQLPVSERKGVPHHLIDVLEVHEDYSAGRFHDDAHAAIRDVLSVSASCECEGDKVIQVSQHECQHNCQDNASDNVLEGRSIHSLILWPELPADVLYCVLHALALLHKEPYPLFRAMQVHVGWEAK